MHSASVFFRHGNGFGYVGTILVEAFWSRRPALQVLRYSPNYRDGVRVGHACEFLSE